MSEQVNRIYQIDKNFVPPSNAPEDIEYYNVLEPQFTISGLIPHTEGEEPFLRMPKATAEAVSEGVAYLSKCSAGGRIRFATDSSDIVIRYILKERSFLGHMPRSGSCGADVYSAPYGERVGSQRRILTIFPSTAEMTECSGVLSFSGVSMRDFTVNLPLYNGVSEMYIGIKKGSSLLAPTEYSIAAPVMFYGSSITQGGCASRPGNAYFAILSRMLDCDYYCLGFSGSAKGEQVMAEYIASLELSAFVMDYDHNATDIKQLEETHYSFYQTFRRLQPDTPVIFISKPDFENSPENSRRRDIVMESYLKAKSGGDKKVTFIDGETLFGSFFRDECTVDGCHPNDLGFCMMAQTIYPKLKSVLYPF